MNTKPNEIVIESKLVKESIISKISLITIMIMTAIMLLISIIVNRKSYSIEINESVTISRKIVEIINYIPSSHWLLVVLIIYLIYSMLRKGINRMIGYVISLMIIEIGIELTMSELMLENVTNLYVVKVSHTIPIETRLDYLNLEIGECYKQTAMISTMIEGKLQSIATNIERSVELLRLNSMNAGQITTYARELFIKAVVTNDIHSSVIYEGTINLTGMTTMMAVIYALLPMLKDIGVILITEGIKWLTS
jgi:hypothetical protein